MINLNAIFVTVRFKNFFIFITVFTLFLISHITYARDIGWGSYYLTMNRFDKVDCHGNVSLVQKIGKMETKQGFHLPIYTLFNSAHKSSSPFAGYGWRVSLLESFLVQQDENWFKVFLPNGQMQYYVRDKNNNKNLKAFREWWTGKIQGNTITLRSERGNKLVFQKGKLVSMKLEEGTFNYVYKKGRLEKIVEGGKTVLKVTEKDDTIWLHLLINKHKIGLKQGQRPQIHVINKQKRPGGTVKCLSKIIESDGTPWSFEYGTDKELNPTMKINVPEMLWSKVKRNYPLLVSREIWDDVLESTLRKKLGAYNPSNDKNDINKLNPMLKFPDRNIAWDAATDKVIRDGKWTYTIKTPNVMEDANAAITRVNTQNQKEFWYRNKIKGEEISEKIDGVRKISRWFTSGKLRGKLRYKERAENGVISFFCKYSYNEKGQLIRVRQKNSDTFYVYEKDGRLAGQIRNGYLVRDYTGNAASLAKQYIKE